jgi:hypothetical protein
MLDFGDAVGKGLRFCIEPKRWLPLLVLDGAVLGMVLLFLLTNADMIITGILGTQDNPLVWLSFGGYILGMILVFSLWYILRTWVMGSIIHQSFRPREFEKGFKVSLNRLHKVIVAVLLVALISGVLGSIPYAGFIVSIVIGLAFFFVFQGIILDDLGVVSTLKNSWKLFRESPFDVFIAWLIIAIMSLLIMGVFALPLIGSVFSLFLNVVSATGTLDSGSLALLLVYIQSNISTFAALGIVALVGLELSQVFAIKTQTEVYLQMRKSFPSIIKEFSKKVGRFF